MVDYITTNELKTALPDGSVATTYDTFLNYLVTTVSRCIDRFTKRHNDAFAVASATTRYFTGNGERVLDVDEMAAAPTAVAVAEAGDIDDASGTGGDYTTWASSDYLLWPYNAPDLDLPYSALEIDVLNGTKWVWYRYPKAVKITAKWGYSEAAPEAIKHACIIQAARWFKRGQQAYMDDSAYTDFGVITIKQLDPDVANILQHYIRTVI